MAHFHHDASHSQTKTHKCACERNWCPVCSLPSCRPTRDSKWAKDSLASQYQKDYAGKVGLRGELGDLAKKDKLLVPSLAKFDPTTTNRADFTEKKGSLWGRHKNDGAVPNRPFEGQSTYNTFHQGKAGLPRDARSLPAQLRSAPFGGISTNNADYIDYGPQPRAATAPAREMVLLPFNGSSTYKDDFTSKQLPPREPHLPPPHLPSRNEANYTTYGTDFVGHPLNRTVGQCCDHPHHPLQHVHLAVPVGGSTELMGSTTGRLYRLR